jgi:hypothetical protein
MEARNDKLDWVGHCTAVNAMPVPAVLASCLFFIACFMKGFFSTLSCPSFSPFAHLLTLTRPWSREFAHPGLQHTHFSSRFLHHDVDV